MVFKSSYLDFLFPLIQQYSTSNEEYNVIHVRCKCKFLDKIKTELNGCTVYQDMKDLWKQATVLICHIFSKTRECIKRKKMG